MNRTNQDKYKILGGILAVIGAIGLLVNIIVNSPTAPKFKNATKDSKYLFAAENKIFDVSVGIKEANKPIVEFSTTDNTNIKFLLLGMAV